MNLRTLLNLIFSIPVYALLILFISTKLVAQTYTFTPAGASGSGGPTQTMVNTSYTNTNLSGSVTVVANGFQTFTINTTGVYRLHAWGAQGGYNGGRGAYIAGDFTLTSGTVLRMAVGQQGSVAVNAQNRGSGGGGGGSFIAINPITPLVVAGGGGGYGDGYTSTTLTPQLCCFPELNASLTTTANPFPGGTNNGSAGNGGTCGSSSAGAGAGFYTFGQQCNCYGAAVSFTNINAPIGSAGNPGAGNGGFGGGGGGYNSANGNRGGGGGGYSGGGGGNAITGSESSAPGGGGASYNNGNNQVNTISTYTGDGKIVIEHLCNIPITVQGFGNYNGVICSGNTLTLSAYGNGNYLWSNNSTNTFIVVSPTVSTTYSLIGLSPFSCQGTGSVFIQVNPGLPLVGAVANSPTICLGDTVNLNASGAITYSWNNIPNNNGGAITYTPQLNTTYTLTGENACGTNSTVISVSVIPLPVAVSASPAAICSGTSTTLFMIAPANYYTVLPGLLVTGGPNFLVTPNVTTTYTIEAANGVCRGSNTVQVTVYPLPLVTLSTSANSICLGDAITLTATGGITYSWIPANFSGPQQTINPSTTTNYVVLGNNNFGCINAAAVLVTVKPVPNFTLSQSSNYLCAGRPATLTAVGANTFSWNPIASSFSTVVVNPSASTIYSCIGTGSNGCKSTKTLTIAAFNPSVAISSPSAICLGQSATITAGTAASYTWNGVPGGPVNIVGPLLGSTYTLAVTNYSTNLTCTALTTISIAVNPNPIVSIITTKDQYCEGETVLLKGFGASTYTWNSASTGSIFTSIVNSTSLIALLGSNEFNCSTQTTKYIYADPCTGLLQNQWKEDKVPVFPNPNQGDFYVELPQNSNLLLINVLGQKIDFDKTQYFDNRYQIKNLQTGFYLLIDEDTMQTIAKIVVQE